MSDLQPLHDAVISGDAKATRAITEKALQAGVDPLKLVNEFMVPAMDEVGRRFECNEYFVPELLLSARAMKAALELGVRRIVVGECGHAWRVAYSFWNTLVGIGAMTAQAMPVLLSRPTELYQSRDAAMAPPQRCVTSNSPICGNSSAMSRRRCSCTAGTRSYSSPIREL